MSVGLLEVVVKASTAMVFLVMSSSARPALSDEPAAPPSATGSAAPSTIGWKGIVGVPAVALGSLTAVGGAVALLAGAVVLTTPTDPNQGPLGFGLFGGGLAAGVVGGVVAVGGGALIAWDLSDGE
jgi:hypothetical protein